MYNVPEEVLLCEGQVVLRVWVIRALGNMTGVAEIAILLLADKAERRELTRAGGAHWVESQQTVEAHT